MPTTIKCDIVSARRELFSGEITHCVVTGTGGELGIYPRHAPLMTTLQAGEVRLWDSDDQERTFIIGGGILEVMPHVVTVLADTAVRAADVDEAAAKQAKAEAERELQTRSGRMDIAEAQAKLAEAVAQLRALERLRRQLKRK
jgi:F-type H+-transporting ATPase subunit epsilon